MKKTNFDRYLEKQLEDSAFAARFKRAGEPEVTACRNFLFVEMDRNADRAIR